MTTFSLFNVLAVQDVSSDGETDQEVFDKTSDKTLKVDKIPNSSSWADYEHEDPTFQKVVKRTKKKGDGSQKNKHIGKLIFVHPSGRWGKIERQDTGERIYTQLTNNIFDGSRVQFIMGENHKGACALSVELI